MKNKAKISALFLVISLFSGCTTETSNPQVINNTIIKQSEALKYNGVANETTPPNTTTQTIQWKTYSNKELGFEMKVPEKVLADYTNPDSLVPLNIFEDKGNVYFTTHSLIEAVNGLWQFQVRGTTVKKESDVVATLEKIYDVKGCAVEFNQDPQNPDMKYVPIFAKNENLMPDDPMACFIGGKVTTMYDTKSGKLITYSLVERFFFEPGDQNADEEALASFKFMP